MYTSTDAHAHAHTHLTAWNRLICLSGNVKYHCTKEIILITDCVYKLFSLSVVLSLSFTFCLYLC